MLFALELFLVGEFPARRSDLVLCLDMRGIGSGRLRVCLVGRSARHAEIAPDAGDLEA